MAQGDNPDGLANVYRDVCALLRNGQPIAATKKLKDEFGLGWLEAKRLMEAINESIVHGAGLTEPQESGSRKRAR